MQKNWLTAILLLFTVISASSQTLFTYGKYKADAKDFLRAFNKNNQQTGVNKTAALKEYLDLYINSRLKIREAYDRQYDTLPHIKSEIENLRSQVIDNYMSDPEAINRLTREAFQRSLKDIHAAHIFISFTNTAGSPDTTAARRKLEDVSKRLAKKEDFLAVAQQLSDDPSARTNKGDLDYVTAFTLPYEFENIIYTTPTGKYSKPYTSKAGYHIFKTLGERKALGKIKVQQILLAFPPGTDEAGKKATARLADSLYQRLKTGDDFAKMAAAFSNDYVSAAREGNIPDISVGQYDPAFEKIAWSLKEGTVSKPFVTTHGYHIVKKISSKSVVTNAADKSNTQELEQRVRNSDRWKTAKDFIYASVLERAGFTKSLYDDAVLWALSDSLLDSKPAGKGRNMNTRSALFKLGDTTINVDAWINYSQVNRYKADRATLKPYPELMDEFKKQVFYQYYRDHLEDFNTEFRNQMDEFRDGNLFFEIMQQEVWNKAQADSVALLSLYQKNKDQYHWQPGADAIIFFCTDEGAAKALADQLKKNAANWKVAVEAVSEKVVADSARYEWPQIPGIGQSTPKEGSVTAVAVNPGDKTASFAFINKVYTKPETRSFDEAKGLVMNDYQTLLEEEWIGKLKKKYPVKVDEKVLAELSE
jgi:peptidyl-prolyl cis-trans isomerase SurA